VPWGWVRVWPRRGGAGRVGPGEPEPDARPIVRLHRPDLPWKLERRG
jgi:hypothetical protein